MCLGSTIPPPAGSAVAAGHAGYRASRSTVGKSHRGDPRSTRRVGSGGRPSPGCTRSSRSTVGKSAGGCRGHTRRVGSGGRPSPGCTALHGQQSKNPRGDRGRARRVGSGGRPSPGCTRSKAAGRETPNRSHPPGAPADGRDDNLPMSAAPVAFPIVWWLRHPRPPTPMTCRATP